MGSTEGFSHPGNDTRRMEGRLLHRPFQFEPEHLAFLRRCLTQPGRWSRAQAPSKWATTLPNATVPEVISGYSTPLNRQQLREFCRNMSADVLVCYLFVMAWGGQRRDHARNAWRAREKLKPALYRLRAESLSRSDAFKLFQGNGEVPGLGVAFFTKLMYFFSQSSDHYILDQWTAKSVNLLLARPLIPIDNRVTVSRRTTPEQYVEYCEAIVALGCELGLAADQTEQLLLSEGGRKPAPWRKHVVEYFSRSRVPLPLR